MKNLSTVVEDIYETLSCLSESKDLEIPDELLEDFGERMKEVLRNWSKPYKAKTSLRMSIIGRPLRRLWYDLKKGHLSKAHMPSSTLIKFLYGHMCEEVLLLFVKMAGHRVEAEQKEVVVDGVKGHMDCKIDGEVVDIKTASSFAFKKFAEGTLHSDDPFGYMGQLAGYEEGEGTDEGGFLAMNKESGELALYQPGPLVKINVREKIRRIREAEKLDYPPSRCYNPIPEGKSGNMRLPRQCVYCPHKIDCHSDANNRKGLRVFRYSSGLKYLTRVIVEPKVLEVIAYER
jgi:hypothetical protein